MPTALLLLCVFLPLAAGHGAIVRPPPRNAIDAHLAPWNASVVPLSGGGHSAPFDPWCPIPDIHKPESSAGRLSGSNGQACFWFSSGCSIGCPTCDGKTRGPIPNIACRNATNKNEMCAHKMPVCDTGLQVPTLPKEARTVNTDKEDGAEDDYYQFSPWRAPGSAGVMDPCGVAGGSVVPVKDREYGIHYTATEHAKQGDEGTRLPKRNTGTVWTAGDVVEVSWSLNANHGGGYYWRLCRLPEDGSRVTEECFQQTTLQFVGNTTLRWNGNSSTDEEIDNVFVSAGTHPAGSTWAMNPIPRNDTHQTGASFKPKCKETCTGCSGGQGGPCNDCRCTGEWGPANLEIVDHVALPWMLPEGDYVLGWRWDCEESNQVWQGCSDVYIKPCQINCGT